MISGGNATIHVSDMDQAVRFYTETLELALVFRAGNHWATVDAGAGLQLGLHPAGPSTPAPGSTGAITIGLAVDQPLEDVVAVLVERDVVVHSPIREDGTIRLVFISDPDGNQLYLAEPSSP